MYIHYQKINGIEYAVLAQSSRKGKKVVRKSINLGRVVDKERNIFRNRERGYFVYDLITNTYSAPPKDFIVPESLERKKSNPPRTLRFGCTFVLNALCEKFGIVDIVKNQIGVSNPDSFLALLYYYVLSKSDNEYAELWYDGDYIRYLFPNARMGVTDIDTLLAEAGDEYLKQRFFKAYLDLVPELKDGEKVLIDSTGLPNAVHLPLTCLRTETGLTSMETHLIYVVKPNSELPIFYQYNPGNLPDKKVYRNLLEDISAYGIKVDNVIVDVGSCGMEDISECLGLELNFFARLNQNLALYKEAKSEVGSELESDTNCVVQPGRILYVSELEKIIGSRSVYLYVVLDTSESFVQTRHIATPKNGKLPVATEVSQKRKESGKFVILSTRHLQKDSVAALYCKRMEVEQLFDVEKDYMKALPMEIHSEQTFRGHLLFTFIGAVMRALIHQQLTGRDIHGKLPLRDGRRGRSSGGKIAGFDLIEMFLFLENQGCICYEKKLVPDVPNKDVNEVYKFFNLKLPNHYLIEKNGGLRTMGKNIPQN